MTEGDGGWTARAVAADLERAIRRGDYAPGSRIPSRTGLRAQYGVSDSTAHRAYRTLRDAGLVYAVTGGGWYVRPRRPVVRATRVRLTRAERQAGRGFFTSDCHAAGLTPDVDVEVSTRPAPDHVAADLDIEPDSPVLVRDRVMRADGEVLQLATSYLPADLAEAAPALALDNPGPGGSYARLEDAGWVLTQFTETVSIGRASEHEAAAMSLTAGDPLFRVVRIAWSGDRPVEVNHIVITGDRYELAYEFPAE